MEKPRPSNLARIIACPASLRLCAGVKDEPSSYANEGTAAHTLGERCARAGTIPAEHYGETITVEGADFPVDNDMAVAVTHYVMAMRGIARKAEHVWFERRITMPFLDNSGTADFVAVNYTEGWIEMIDYKNGSGVYVSEKNNAQFFAYALGAVMDESIWPRHLPDPEKITVTCAQPRFEDAYPVRSQHVTVEGLEWWRKERLEPALAKGTDPSAAVSAGDHCRFCPARRAKICPAGQRVKFQRPKVSSKPVAPITATPIPDNLTF